MCVCERERERERERRMKGWMEEDAQEHNQPNVLYTSYKILMFNLF